MPSSRPDDSGVRTDVLGLFRPGQTKTAQQSPLRRSRSPRELLGGVTARLGREWVTWEPETLWAELKRRAGKLPDEITRNKIQAARTLLTSESFWKDHWVFEKVVLAFNSRVPVFNEYQRPSPAMIAKGILEAGKIRDLPFSDEIRTYVALVAFLDGLILLPEPLEFAQDALNGMTSYATPEDLRAEVKRRMSEKPPAAYTESPADIQLARVWAIREYLKAS